MSVRGQVRGVQRPLLCFRSTGLYARRLPSLGRVPASPVPRRHQYYEDATTSRSRTPGSLWIRFQAPRVPPFVRARRSAPTERGGRSAGLGVWSAGVPLSGVLHPWARAGHHRFPGNPSYALALLQDPGRADKTSPLTASSILPPGTEHRRPQRIIISRLTQGFSSAVYASRAASPPPLQDSLPAGGLRLCREGVEPSGLLRKVSGYIAIPLSRTSPVAISLNFRFRPLAVIQWRNGDDRLAPIADVRERHEN